MTYLEGDDPEEECLFCERSTNEDGPDNLILHRGKHAFIILNRFPYTNGHMMVVPFAHEATTERLDEATLLEMLQLANTAINCLRQTYGAASFNVGINIGRPAGAGIAEHVHIHVLARWDGDTNFMATTSRTRVIPESLDQTYSRLRSCLDQI